MWTCKACGYVVDDDAQDKCPKCKVVDPAHFKAQMVARPYQSMPEEPEPEPEEPKLYSEYHRKQLEAIVKNLHPERHHSTTLLVSIAGVIIAIPIIILLMGGATMFSPTSTSYQTTVPLTTITSCSAGSYAVLLTSVTIECINPMNSTFTATQPVAQSATQPVTQPATLPTTITNTNVTPPILTTIATPSFSTITTPSFSITFTASDFTDLALILMFVLIIMGAAMAVTDRDAY